jgi:hypothetical protein
MRTIDEIRRANLEILLSEAGSQAEIGRRIDRTPNQVNQWFGKGSSRNIGDKSARELEVAFDKPKGWMDQDHNSESQSAGRVPEKFRASVELLYYTLSNLGKPLSLVSDDDLLELAYRTVDEDGRDLSPAVMLDLNQRLASRIRLAEEKDGSERREVERTGAEARGANSRGGKRSKA